MAVTWANKHNGVNIMKRALFTAFAVLLTACAPLGVGTGVPALASGLVPFDACEDFLSHVKTEAKRIVTPYGLDYGWYGPVWFGDDVVMMVAEAAGAVPVAGGEIRQNIQPQAVVVPAPYQDIFFLMYSAINRTVVSLG